MVEKSTLDGCLKDIGFPADRDELVECASGNSCPSDVIGQLRDMPSMSYHSTDDVLCRLGDISYC